MFLSKVLLKPGRLDNAWEWHRALWTLFPGIERQENTPSPFLFWVERMHLVEGASVLMYSTLEPMPESDKATVLSKKRFEPQFHEGQRLHFLLTANVTKTIRDEVDPERKIRVPLLKEEQQRAWLGRKLSENVLVDVDSVGIQEHPPVYFRKGNKPGKIVLTTFEGIFQVQHPESLNTMLSRGVGAAKAFGCGLLLVRRV